MPDILMFIYHFVLLQSIILFCFSEESNNGDGQKLLLNQQNLAFSEDYDCVIYTDIQ